ncbi:MAG: hypothetical protein ABEH81_02915 [Halopenitus sp.]
MPEYGETWVYESLVGAIPGLDLSDRNAILIQLVVFEGAVLALAAWYDLWGAVPAGTAAVVVATVGSWLMLLFSRRVRELPTAEPYRRLLFGSSVDMALSVLAFVLLVTYLFVVDPRRGGTTLVQELLGPRPPPLAVVLMLLVAWDVAYRIGTCWWATVVGFWRAIKYRYGPKTTEQAVRTDAVNIVFAAVQLLLVPFVAGHPILAVAILGHLGAVVVVACASIGLQRRRTRPASA